jgi:hypothetical protein
MKPFNMGLNLHPSEYRFNGGNTPPVRGFINILFFSIPDLIFAAKRVKESPKDYLDIPHCLYIRIRYA